MLFKQPKPKFDFDAELSDLLDRATDAKVHPNRIIDLFDSVVEGLRRRVAISAPHAGYLPPAFDGYGREIKR